MEIRQSACQPRKLSSVAKKSLNIVEGTRPYHDQDPMIVAVEDPFDHASRPEDNACFSVANRILLLDGIWSRNRNCPPDPCVIQLVHESLSGFGLGFRASKINCPKLFISKIQKSQ